MRLILTFLVGNALLKTDFTILRVRLPELGSKTIDNIKEGVESSINLTDGDNRYTEKAFKKSFS